MNAQHVCVPVELRHYHGRSSPIILHFPEAGSNQSKLA